MSLSNNKWERNDFFLGGFHFSHLSQADLMQTDMAAVSDCPKRHPYAPREARASYTVEAAVVMPIFLFVCACVLIFFRVLTVEWGVSVALNETAREMALYRGADTAEEIAEHREAGGVRNAAAVSVPESAGEETEHAGKKDARLTATAAALTHTRIVAEDTPLSFVRFGIAGLDYSASAVDGKNVDIAVSYRVPLPVRFFGLGDIRITQHAKAHRWVGFDPREGKGQDGETVYVTEHGVAYHRDLGCSYLNPSIRPVAHASVDDKRNASGHKYYPCPLCGGTATTVYITTYGENYHSDIGCSGLKRTIRSTTQKEAEAEGYHACGKCGK